MKKLLMALLAMLLTLAMVLSLAACGEDDTKRKRSRDDDDDDDEKTTQAGESDDDDTDKDDDKDDNKDDNKVAATDPASAVVGKWRYSVDMSEFVNLIYETALGISVSDSPWEYVVYFNFKADGTYTTEVDTEELLAGAGPFVDDMLSAIAEMAGMDVDTMLRMQGMTREEYTQQMIDSLASSIAVGQTSTAGTYVVNNGTIALDDSGPSVFTIKGNVMTVQVPDGFREQGLQEFANNELAAMIDVESLVDSMIDVFYPMKLTRVK